MSAPQANEAEKNIEIWKVKKLIKRLEAARGNGTSMISLIIRAFILNFDISVPALLTELWCSPKRSGFTSSQNVG